MSNIYTTSEKLDFIASVFGSGRLASNGKNFDVKCPICDPRDANKKKLAIRVEDDANHCWICGWRARSLAPLIKKYGTQSQLMVYRDKFMQETHHNKSSRCIVVDIDEIEIKLPDDFAMLALSNSKDPDVKSALRYLNSRGIDEHDLWYYKIGSSDDYRWRRRIIIPSFDGTGLLNYYVARTIDKQRKPKYDNPNVDKLHVIFNELNIDWSSRLVLCEGAFDLMKCGENATCLLGSNLNEESILFNKIIAHSTPIALALDADMEKKSFYLAKKLSEYDVDVILVDTSSHDDPGKMTKGEFKIALEQAKPYSWQESLLTRLNDVSKMSLGM